MSGPKAFYSMTFLGKRLQFLKKRNYESSQMHRRLSQ